MPQPDYGPLDRILHRIALGPNFVRQACFDLQGQMTSGKALPEVLQPVFIAGLARSGSTILLNALFETGAFRSLTYRDMPFVLMPGLWAKLSASSQTDAAAKERAHGDRLLVEYDSPEAFEEIFWSTFCGDKYIYEDRVVPHEPSRAALSHYRKFVQYVLASKEQGAPLRYLAKNNNNLLRLPALKRAFPDAHLLIPFRAPLQHAVSLLRQHQQFLDAHDQDKFSMQYMNWLGHFEFGLGHKNYAFSARENSFDPVSTNYWLQCWLDAYQLALESAPEDAIFLGYEQLCTGATTTFGALYTRLNLSTDSLPEQGFYQAAEQRTAPDIDEQLLHQCEALYERLLTRQFCG